MFLVIVKIRKDVVDYIYVGFFIVIMALFLTGQFSTVTGTSLVVIDNADPNSMFPTYFQGDLFVIQRHNPQDIHLGDVIVYTSKDDSRIIHRVVDIVIQQGTYYFRVKGDDPVTNFIPDPYGSGSLIPFSAVLGKIVARVPYVGHISLAMQQNIAIQMLIYVLAFGIVLAIFIMDNDEEEGTEKYYNISAESFKQTTDQAKAQLSRFLRLFTGLVAFVCDCNLRIHAIFLTRHVATAR